MFMYPGHDVLSMKSAKKGKTNTKKTGGMDWKKAVLIFVGVGFAVTMVLSSLGPDFMVGRKAIEPGETAIVEYTLRDAAGRAVITTSERVYTPAYQNGEMVWYTGPLSLVAGAATGEMITPVPVYRDDYGEADFGLFGQEQNQIAAGLIGMKERETKRLVLTGTDQYQQEITGETFNEMGGNFSVAAVGDQFPLAFMTSVVENEDGTQTVEYALRVAWITGKDHQNVSFSYGYPVAEISVAQVSSR